MGEHDLGPQVLDVRRDRLTLGASVVLFLLSVLMVLATGMLPAGPARGVLLGLAGLVLVLVAVLFVFTVLPKVTIHERGLEITDPLLRRTRVPWACVAGMRPPQGRTNNFFLDLVDGRSLRVDRLSRSRRPGSDLPVHPDVMAVLHHWNLWLRSPHRR